MIQNVNNKNVVNSTVFIVMNFKLFFSTVLIVTLVSFPIFSDGSYEKGGWNHRPFKSLNQVIVVNVIPCSIIVTYGVLNPK